MSHSLYIVMLLTYWRNAFEKCNIFVISPTPTKKHAQQKMSFHPAKKLLVLKAGWTEGFGCECAKCQHQWRQIPTLKSRITQVRIQLKTLRINAASDCFPLGAT